MTRQLDDSEVQHAKQLVEAINAELAQLSPPERLIIGACIIADVVLSAPPMSLEAQRVSAHELVDLMIDGLGRRSTGFLQ